jgi:histidinol dehydrogenase
MIRFIKTEEGIRRFLSLLRKRAEGVDEEKTKAVEEILRKVKKRGDKALLYYTKKLDGIELKRFRLLPSEIKKQARKVSQEVYSALRLAAERIRQYHQHQIERSWKYTERGVTLGQLIRPLNRVGVYVPGGKASYPSTVLMNVIPAQVAGVKEIALCVPTPKGEVNPALMAAIEIVGVKEVYRVGGAQAIAALAYGTESIPKVDKIVGPGNIYVALAKKMVFGTVDIDMFAGPSEVLVIGDNSARADLVAADLLSQAEHDELASSVFITTSEILAIEVIRELKRQLRLLPKRQIAEASLRNYGAIILVKTLRKAVEIANSIAPEHLEIMTRDPEALVKDIENAGAVFLGQWSPEPMGDYVAGPNHTLPTSGTARFFSPLGVYDFIKRTSVIMLSETAFRRLAPSVIVLSETEGLDAHGKTVSIRLGDSKGRR